MHWGQAWQPGRSETLFEHDFDSKNVARTYLHEKDCREPTGLVISGINEHLLVVLVSARRGALKRSDWK